MGPEEAHPDLRFPDARDACSATPVATRPESIFRSGGSLRNKEGNGQLQNHHHGVPEPLTRSLSSHRNSPTNTTKTRVNSLTPVFDTALYDPTSDSIHIMPHSRDSSLDTQFRNFKKRVSIIKSQEPTPQHLQHPAERPHSLNLPLRNLDESIQRNAIDDFSSEHNLPSRNASFRQGHSRGKSFDLMAAPPGRKRSRKSTMNLSATIDCVDSVDANPSEALTSQIASAVLKERHSLRSKTVAPLKSKETAAHANVDVDRPEFLKVSPEWEVPRYCPAPSTRHSRSSLAGSRSSPRASEHRLKPKPRGIQRYPSSGAIEDDEDPFLYDGASRTSDSGEICLDKIESAKFRGYPCPFRRRNPIRFNIRDHENCGRRPFLDMSELKCHIRTHHQMCQNGFRCPRCKSQLSSSGALANHLTVPVEELCEPQLVAVEHQVEDGITEYMDRLLASKSPRNAVQSWDDLWQLLFPQDTTVLEPELLPVIEVFEAEQEYDDSAAELKADLCESLQRLLPDQSGDALFYSVLAGQLSLVFEQHRAKINRRCRNNASGDETRSSTAITTSGTKQTKPSRFSVATHNSSQLTSIQRASLYPESRPRRSQLRSIVPKRTPSPASSVYSQSSNHNHSPTSSSTNYSHSHAASHSSRPTTRSSNSLMSLTGMHVESPRLPFRDWVHGVSKAAAAAANNNNNNNNKPTPSPGQRDSGLALQCEECGADIPCSCEVNCYADQLSAFFTPAAGAVRQPSGLTPYGRGSDDDEDWGVTGRYGDSLLSAPIRMGRDGKVREGLGLVTPV